MTSWTSLLLSGIAYTILLAGFVLEKKGIAWIGFKGKKDSPYYRDLAVWSLGFILVNLYIVPNTVALKALSPHVAASVAGWGVAVMVFLSWVLLGERLYRADFLDTGLMAGAIAALNLFDRRSSGTVIRASFMIVASAVPFLLLALSWLRPFSRRYRAVFLAAVSGLCTGMITVAMKALVSLHGFEIKAYFGSPYLYLYLAFSVSAFISLQLAFKAGDMMLAGPAQYSATIIYPVVCSAPVFAARIHPLQPAAILVIVILAVRILRRHWKPEIEGTGGGSPEGSSLQEDDVF